MPTNSKTLSPAPDNFIVVIPSRGRIQLAVKSEQLFGSCNPVVCVSESEKDDYSRACKNVITHPDEVSGIGRIRAWILENFTQEVVVMADDDVSHVWCNMYRTGFAINNPNVVFEILANAANVTADLGLHVFGFSQALDVRKYNATKPINLTGWVGGLVGFVGRRDYKYSTNCLRADIDYCLQSLQEDRIIYQDNRYAFVHQRFGLSGGNSANRSMARDNEELKYLLLKWGRYLDAKVTDAGTLRLMVRVVRKAKSILLQA